MARLVRCIDHGKLLCPDRSAIAICGENIAGDQIAFSLNTADRRVSDHLEELSVFIQLCSVILRPIPDRGVILPQLGAAKPVDSLHYFIDVMIVFRRHMHFHEFVKQAPWQNRTLSILWI
jgi:hypothetical protein